MKLIIVGAGGQGLIVAGIVSAASEAGYALQAIGFVDDDRSLEGTSVHGVPVLGAIDTLRSVVHDGIVVAVGDNHIRRELTLRLEAEGERLVTVRHPWSSIAAGVTVGEGSMISAGTVVTPGARIGRGVLLNTRSSVDHQSIVGDFAHVSAGATVGANVTIGDETLIGLGASVMSNVRVGSRTIVGAGALVARDLPDDVVAIGVPARVRRAR